VRKPRSRANAGSTGAVLSVALAVVDPTGTTAIQATRVISKAGWTPYAGRRLRGRRMATYLRGHRIALGDRPEASLAGEFVPRPGKADQGP
jgi:hypothetical protein